MSSVITIVKCYRYQVPEKSRLRGLGVALIQIGKSPVASPVLKLHLHYTRTKLAHTNQYARWIYEMP